ncbi:MAG: CDP-6-deoxy-delta-3,4-glucoseen reductase [Burkholderiaceae bacterium]
MNFKIELSPGGKSFTCSAEETILAAALHQGVILPYGCKNGACGSCKAQVLAGTLDYGAHQARTLTDQEKVTGHALLCCAKPLSDVRLQARELQGAGDMPVRKMPCRVLEIELAAPDVAIVRLQLPANELLQFKAGQYVEFLLRDNQRRAYSIASPPHRSGQIELHIRHMPGGLFTDQVFSTLKVRDILRFEGPLGTFFLRENSVAPIILLASGTGFAPLQAIVEHVIEQRIQRPLTFYWGGRRRADLYRLPLLEQWADVLPDFRFVPVLSEPDDAWNGRTGFVHRAVMRDFPDMAGFEVYACGAPVMVESARRDFMADCRLPAESFFADAFTSAADGGFDALVSP